MEENYYDSDGVVGPFTDAITTEISLDSCEEDLLAMVLVDTVFSEAPILILWTWILLW